LTGPEGDVYNDRQSELLLAPSAEIDELFKAACQASGVPWAAWIAGLPDETRLEYGYGLSGQRREALTRTLTDKKTRDWIAGADRSGKSRVRSAGTEAKALSPRLSFLPGDGRGILLGGEPLSRPARRLFKSLLKIAPSPEKYPVGLNPPPPQAPAYSPPDAYPRPTGGEDTGGFSRLVFEIHKRLEQIGGLDLVETDMATILKRAVERARDLVSAKGAEIGILDEKEQVVRILVSETPWWKDGRRAIPFGLGVAGQIAQKKAPVLVADYNTWEHRLLPDKPAPFRSAAGVPLVVLGRVIGTLIVIDDRPRRSFSLEDIQLLELLAPQISISIRNARLFQELVERARAQKQAEKRMVESVRLAAIGEMAAGVAHELNNPLTTIAGFTELILEDLPAEFRQREDLELVLREARRARMVVRRLLDFSRRGDNLKHALDINDLLGEVLALIHPLGQSQGVEIQYESWDDLPKVYADQDQLKQVFLNLAYNALQAMPGGGRFLMQTSPAQKGGRSGVLTRVRDDGPGIPEEIREHIFEPFFTTKPVGLGTGLGLSISNSIVLDHGGSLEVETEAGKGASFTVWLPVIDPSPKNEQTG